MKTIKPIATISYNSITFLKQTLKNLEENGKIDFWCFIKHKHEDVESKDHIHVYLEPSNRIDTNDLKKLFIEIKPNAKPLEVMPFRNSKFYDWFYYSMHNIDYLRSKNLIRKYHYSADDFEASNEDYLKEMISTNPLKVDLFEKMLKYACDNMPFYAVMGALNLDARYFTNYAKMYDCACEYVRRNGNKVADM